MAGFRRVIAFFWGIVLLAVSAGIAVCLVNHRIAQVVVDFMDRCFLYNMQLSFIESRNLWWPIIIGIVLFLLGLLFIIAAFKRKRQIKQVEVFAADGGSVNISVAAVDNVVRKAAGSVPGVRNVNSRLHMVRDGLRVALEITLPPDVAVPVISAEVRQQVAQQLETIIGIQAKEISVVVGNVSAEKSGHWPASSVGVIGTNPPVQPGPAAVQAVSAAAEAVAVPSDPVIAAVEAAPASDTEEVKDSGL